MGSGSTSRLYRALVIDQSLAANAGSGYGADRLDLTTFSFRASPRVGVEIEVLEAALRAEIARLLAEGVTEQEVVRAKRRLIASAVYARDSLSTGARVFGTALTTGQSVAQVEAWPERVEAVTADQVNEAAKAVLRDAQSVTAHLLPEPTT